MAATTSGVKRPYAQISSAPERPSVRTEFRLLPVTDAVKRGVQQTVLDLIFVGRDVDTSRYLGARPELPGPLAVTLSRRTLRLVEASDYFVCEKSDGERAMLLMTSKPLQWGVPPGAYIIDRTFDVKTFDRGGEYPPLCAPGGPTLIDGELILRPHDHGTHTGRAVYMMFDVVAHNGLPVGLQTFDKRLEGIGALRIPFRDADRAAATAAASAAPGASIVPGLPLCLLGKLMVPKSRIRAITGNIYETTHHAPVAAGAASSSASSSSSSSCSSSARAGGSSVTAGLVGIAPLESELDVASAGGGGGDASGGGGGGGPHRVYRCDYRVNGTDGLVLTPVGCSYTDMFASAASPLPLLKWKFADENTVDFRLRAGDLDADASGGRRGGGGGGGGAAAGYSAVLSASGEPTRLVPLYVAVPLRRAGGGSDDEPTEASVAKTSLTGSECDAYQTLMARLRVASVIVECGYDVAASCWRIKRVRDKKTRANALTTAWSTLEVMAENITLEELAGVLAPVPGAAAGVPAATAAAGGAAAAPGVVHHLLPAHYAVAGGAMPLAYPPPPPALHGAAPGGYGATGGAVSGGRP